MSMVSINPATGEEIQSYAVHTSDEIQFILHQAVETLCKWKETE